MEHSFGNVSRETFFIMKIQFYSKLPISRNMQVRFSGVGSQNSYFDSASVLSFDDVSIQIVNKGELKIEGYVSTFQPINYMRFTQGEKWIYCFVKNIEYVNNHTTRILYDVDAIQTYLFDVTFLESYILRQHTADDTIANMVNEPQIAPLIYEENFAITPENVSDNRAYLLLAKSGSELALPTVDTYYIGTVPFIGYCKLCTTLEELKTELDKYTAVEVGGLSLGTTDRIIAIYDVPEKMCNVGTTAKYYSASTLIAKPTTLDGYTPKNNKMYQYPFMKVTASNNRGNKRDFAYEGFGESGAFFNLFADVGLNDSMVLVPSEYLGTVNDFDLAITNTNRLDIPFQQNNFTWSQIGNMLQSANNASISAIENSAGAIAGQENADVPAITGILGFASAFQDVGAEILFGYPQNSGICNSDLLTAIGVNPFRLSAQTLRADIAKLYDDYFTRYGYAQNKVEQVNIYKHDNYCYIKTQELHIRGEIPREYMQEFKDIFNSGVTFFDTMGKVGYYE